MNRSCVLRRRRLIVFNAPKWMCSPLVPLSPENVHQTPDHPIQRLNLSGMSDRSVAEAMLLKKVGAWPNIRVLAWDEDVLYGSRGYQIIRLKLNEYTRQQSVGDEPWEPVARFRPLWWRNLTVRTNLTYRLTREGFHALCVVGDHSNEQTMVGAVPGAIVTKTSVDDEFLVTHQVHRGTRPLRSEERRVGKE